MRETKREYERERERERETVYVEIGGRGCIERENTRENTHQPQIKVRVWDEKTSVSCQICLPRPKAAPFTNVNL